MRNKLFSPYALSLLSGSLTFIALCRINFIAGCICYIPLFIALQDKPYKQVFKIAAVFAACYSLFAFFWMIPAAGRFTGTSSFYGMAAFILSLGFYSLFWSSCITVFTYLEARFNRPPNILCNSILAACIFCLADALMNSLTKSLPWFNFHAGSAMLRDINAIQPAAYFGIHVLTFMIIFVNYFAAKAIQQKKWRLLAIPAGSLAVYLVIGFLMLGGYTKGQPAGNASRVVIISENIAPEMKWDPETGNELAARMLNMNREAVKAHPQIILWSESAIPWNYSPGDDLLKEVRKITDPAGASHVIGINSDGGPGFVYNSVYSVSPGGKILGRYDKQYLLSFLEKPLLGLSVPFLAGSEVTGRTGKKYSAPLNTPAGHAGILICNEATVQAPALAQAEQGAEFFMNLSNDGWFSDTYIMEIHFYYARLRAVETRKDIAVNSNRGISGMINSSGMIEAQNKSTEPSVIPVQITPNKFLSFTCRYPALFIYACMAFPLLLIGIPIIKRN